MDGAQHMCRRLGQRPVRGRLAQVGGEIPAHALERVGPQEAGEPDRALRQFEQIEPGPLDGKAGQVDVGDRGLEGGAGE